MTITQDDIVAMGGLCLDDAHGPLGLDEIQRLMQVVSAPEWFWARDFGLVLRYEGGSLTLWQAWIATDPKAPQKQSIFRPARIPTREQVLRAIEYAMFLPAPIKVGA